jgi:hypothetical protein
MLSAHAHRADPHSGIGNFCACQDGMYQCTPCPLFSIHTHMAGTYRMLDCRFGWRVQPYWVLQGPNLPSMDALCYEFVIALAHSYRNFNAVVWMWTSTGFSRAALSHVFNTWLYSPFCQERSSLDKLRTESNLIHAPGTTRAQSNSGQLTVSFQDPIAIIQAVKTSIKSAITQRSVDPTD